MLSKCRLFFVVTLFSLSLASAADVIVDFDRTADFSKFKSYRWMQADSLPIFRALPNQSGAISDQDIDRIIRTAVDEQLAKAKIAPGTAETANLIMSYVAIGQLDMGTSVYDAGAKVGSIPYGHWRPFYQAGSDAQLMRGGTLTVDFVDASTNKIVFRASQSRVMEGQVTAKKFEEVVRKMVKEIFKKFPPKN